jgi:hypothetical protein
MRFNFPKTEIRTMGFSKFEFRPIGSFLYIEGYLVWKLQEMRARNSPSVAGGVASTNVSVLRKTYIRGSFQKFCTLYVFSLKMNLFYKIHLQAFNVISTMIYHSGSRFGQVLYSCLDAFVVDASDYSGRLIRHLLNASEAFPHGVVS